LANDQVSVSTLFICCGSENNNSTSQLIIISAVETCGKSAVLVVETRGKSKAKKNIGEFASNNKYLLVDNCDL
jgi:hypothetical protein